MPEVVSADQATAIALGFVTRYCYFARPKAARKVNGTWTVHVDVGLSAEKLAQIQVDGATGLITEYSVPVPPEKSP